MSVVNAVASRSERSWETGCWWWLSGSLWSSEPWEPLDAVQWNLIFVFPVSETGLEAWWVISECLVDKWINCSCSYKYLIVSVFLIRCQGRRQTGYQDSLQTQNSHQLWRLKKNVKNHNNFLGSLSVCSRFRIAVNITMMWVKKPNSLQKNGTIL